MIRGITRAKEIKDPISESLIKEPSRIGIFLPNFPAIFNMSNPTKEMAIIAVIREMKIANSVLNIIPPILSPK